MSLDLKDFRGKITTEADCVLEAQARVTGKDRQEIAREVLHAWALRQIDEATILGRLLRAEGVAGALEGLPGASQGLPGASQGVAGESQGMRGSKRA
jgi:hypothetical protein